MTDWPIKTLVLTCSHSNFHAASYSMHLNLELLQRQYNAVRRATDILPEADADLLAGLVQWLGDILGMTGWPCEEVKAYTLKELNLP